MSPPDDTALRSWDLGAEQAALRAAGLWRELRVRDGFTAGQFASNDYLGLARSPELAVALSEGVGRYGSGATGSRLICGTTAPHQKLEEVIAAFKGTQAALSFSTGYATALGVITGLLQAGDTVILDKLCHASLVDAARLSGATLRVFPHNHLGKLERLLGTAKGRVLVVTESIFSMDGDAAPLREIVELKDRFGAWLMVDEAHAVGVLGPQGRGLAAELGIEDRVDLQMGTFSKALGLSGGYLAASRQVVDILINRARSFIYSTAPPPAIAHAAQVAVALVSGGVGDGLRERLHANIDLAKSLLPGCPEAAAVAAILPVIIGSEGAAMQLTAAMAERGIFVPAIRYPTVARGAARLRITLSALNEASQIEALAAHLRGAMTELG
ncbi:MAG: 8-amino-7-oxononanoate synthase [Verrucomicrobiales bacterium]|nr:8-amino-7-oxononanoate synthase [Verrucomicrobiales bacterium]MCP5557781.1 8-amino-7-oxononanoate synthase [Verrucomicrobiaceae bacterium]